MEFAYFKTDDTIAAEQARQLLPEGKTWTVDKRWTVRVDRSHANPEDTHNHVQFNGKDVAVINYNNTPSHNSDLSNIPNWLRDWMKNKKLTEAVLWKPSSSELVPKVIIEKALRHEMTMSKAAQFIRKHS